MLSFFPPPLPLVVCDPFVNGVDVGPRLELLFELEPAFSLARDDISRLLVAFSRVVAACLCYLDIKWDTKVERKGKSTLVIVLRQPGIIERVR